MTKRKKPEPKPTPPAADITVDKSETLAGIDPAHPFLADGVVVMAPSEPIARIGSANAVIACPTCGTAKTGNRCEVCGHQEHDT